MTAPRLTLRMPEVAERLGVSRATVQRWVAEGRIDHVRAGRVVLVEPDAIDRFLAAHRERATA